MAAGIATIVAALIGAVAGFLVATYQAKQQAKQSAERAEAERKTQLQTLAMEMVKVELDRANAQGEPSPFPAAAHFAVISDLLRRYGVPTNELDLPTAVDRIRTEYCQMCGSVATGRDGGLVVCQHCNRVQLPTDGSDAK